MIAEMGHVSEGLRLRWFLEFDELGVERVRYLLQNPEEKHRLWGDKGKYAQQWLQGKNAEEATSDYARAEVRTKRKNQVSRLLVGIATLLVGLALLAIALLAFFFRD